MPSVVAHTESALSPVASRPGTVPGEFSGGQPQRVFLADAEMVRDAEAPSAHEVVVAMEELSSR